MESGFEIVRDFVPDLNLRVGYPTLRAYVKDMDGFGFMRYCGWIQTLRLCFSENPRDGRPGETLTMTDVPPVFQEKAFRFSHTGFRRNSTTRR